MKELETTTEIRTPAERLQLLCDEGTLQLIRGDVTSAAMGDKARPGDGVVAGAGRIGDRPMFCYAQDTSFAGGSLGAAHADTIVRVQQMALQARAPVIGFVASGGARMQEGIAALDGYARIFAQHVALSRVAPQISVITGPSAGGGAYSPALTDFTVMTEDASMFLTGPAVVRQAMGEDVTAQDLGGPGVHARNGVSAFTVPTDIDSVFLLRQLLGYLPQRFGAPAPRAAVVAPDGPEPGGQVPLESRRVYDVRHPLAGIVDGGSLLELAPKWAPNMVTAFARLDGHPVGVIANQPRRLGGVIDAAAAEKGAAFVSACDRFGLPLVVLVDTPGFQPGSKQESLGVIRHGATLLRAFAGASVPRFTVILRKAFGGAYITMNSKDLGANLVVAWSRAEIGIMGAEQAVGIVNRRELAAADDPAQALRGLSADYAARHLGAAAAAAGGHVDEVIAPQQTRERLAWALATLG